MKEVWISTINFLVIVSVVLYFGGKFLLNGVELTIYGKYYYVFAIVLLTFFWFLIEITEYKSKSKKQS